MVLEYLESALNTLGDALDVPGDSCDVVDTLAKSLLSRNTCPLELLQRSNMH